MAIRPYKAVIFDRDGTLNRTTRILRAGQHAQDPTDGYVLHPDELELLPTAAQTIALLRQNSVLPFVFTQQNCIHKGLVTLPVIDDIHARMNMLLGPLAQIEAFYVAVSPHDPRAKPAPTMIHEIMSAYALAPHQIVVIGDSRRDCQAAQAAGVDFIWVRDDLARVTEDVMRASGYPVFDDVLSAITAQVLNNSVAPRN